MYERNKEIRKQKRLESLGTNHPVCVHCGADDWQCIEEHHIAGKAYCDDLSLVCCNCHRKLSDDQKDHPKKIDGAPTQMEIIGRWLLGLADLLALVVERMREFGRFLVDAAREAAQAT